MAFDFNLLHALNSWTNHNKILDWIFIFTANYLVYIFAAMAILYWFIYPAQTKLLARKAVTLAFVSFVTARLILTELIRRLLPRLRPTIPHPILDLSQKQTESSFPSGHATAMFSIAMAIYFYNKKLGWWLFAMAILTAIARVVIGVHYPSDVVAGAIVGILTAWVVEKALAIKIEKLVQKLSDFSDRIFGK